MEFSTIFKLVIGFVIAYGACAIIRMVYGFCSEFGHCGSCGKFITPADKKVIVCQQCINRDAEMELELKIEPVDQENE